MKIIKKINGEKDILAVEGRLDSSTAQELGVTLSDITLTCKDLVIDFANLEYVSSAGLRVLITAQKNMNAHKGKMVIVNANEVVRDIFDMTGFSKLIEIKNECQ